MQNNFSHKPFAFLQEESSQKPKPKSDIKKRKPQKKQAQKTEASNLAEDELFLQAVQGIKSKVRKEKTSWNTMENEASFRELFQPNTGKQTSSSHPQKEDTINKQEIEQNLTHEPEQDMQSLLLSAEKHASGKTEEDMLAFAKAMKEVNPLQGKGRDIAKVVLPSMSEEQRKESFANMLEKNVEFSLSLKGEYLEGHVVGLDILTMENLRNGQYSPEAHLDLHGLNAEQAYHRLVNFFRSAWYKGMRTLLLIPGRGKNSPNGFGVLRDKLQLWLTQDPFKRVVLAFCTGKATDGGAGTMYVLLRKYKKKGKINWERLPADPDLY